MYIQTVSENYLNASKQIFDQLHTKSNRENIILNTRFKVCRFPFHAENLSMKFTFTGSEFYEYGKRRVAVSPSNFLIINQGQEHASWIESNDWVNSFAIYFTPSLAAGVFSDLLISDEKLVDDPFELIDHKGTINFFQNLFPFSEDFIRDVSSFKAYLESTGGQEQLIVDDRLRSLLSSFILEHQRDILEKTEKIEAVKRSTKIEILRRLHIARDFIESFYTSDINLKQISETCFLSENLLLRYFRNAFGISPHQYIINRRLDMAKDYLQNSDRSFNEITLLAGFECPSSFGRLFKNRFGYTPLTARH